MSIDLQTGNIFREHTVTHMSNIEFISRTYEELLQLKNKNINILNSNKYKTNDPIEKKNRFGQFTEVDEWPIRM